MRKLIIWGIITFVLLGNVFAKDDLCPDRDSDGNVDCGRYKTQCKISPHNFQNALGDEEKFKGSLLRNEVDLAFSTMRNAGPRIEKRLKVYENDEDDIKKDTTLSEEEKKEDLLFLWEDFYTREHCGNYYPNFITCMGNALTSINGNNTVQQHPESVNFHYYSSICGDCVGKYLGKRNNGNEYLKCANDKFSELEMKGFDKSVVLDSEDEEGNDNEEGNKEENPDGTEENVEEQQDEGEDEALEENGDMDGIIAGKEESTTAEQKQQNPETVKAKSNLGIKMNSDCLVHGGCSLDVYKTLGMRADSGNEDRTSVLSFFQDIIGAATFFIGTIVTIAFVWSGFQCVVAGRNGDSSGRSKAVKGMLYSIIGLIIVMSSYAIIRLVQYLAATGG